MGIISSWLGCATHQNHDEKNTSVNRKRNCTDVPMIGLMVIIIGVIISCGWVRAWKEGNSYRMYNGVDYNKRICGHDISDKPYAYWPAFKTHPRFKICTDDCNKSTSNLAAQSNNVLKSYPSETFLGRYCRSTNIGEETMKKANFDTGLSFIFFFDIFTIFI